MESTDPSGSIYLVVFLIANWIRVKERNVRAESLPKNGQATLTMVHLLSLYWDCVSPQEVLGIF